MTDVLAHLSPDVLLIVLLIVLVSVFPAFAFGFLSLKCLSYTILPSLRESFVGRWLFPIAVGAAMVGLWLLPSSAGEEQTSHYGSYVWLVLLVADVLLAVVWLVVAVRARIAKARRLMAIAKEIKHEMLPDKDATGAEGEARPIADRVLKSAGIVAREVLGKDGDAEAEKASG